MSKIKFDYDSISRYVIPKLDSSISHINACKNTLQSMRIPNDFQYLSYLRNLNSSINSDSEKVSKIKNLINSSNDSFNKNINDFNLDINNIKTVKFHK